MELESEGATIADLSHPRRRELLLLGTLTVTNVFRQLPDVANHQLPQEQRGFRQQDRRSEDRPDQAGSIRYPALSSPLTLCKGEAAVGKSSLVVRFANDEFLENREPTIGGI